MSLFDDMEDYAYERERRIIQQEARIVSENSRKKKKPLFTRGYKESRDRLSKNPYYSRSCFNCAYYYQASGDKEEVCQNEDVLQFDMVVTDNNVYCIKWQPLSNKTNQQSLFKKNGRAKLD